MVRIQAKDFKRKKNNILTFTLLFFFVIAIGYLPLYLQGRTMIWEIDGIGQYYPAFLYIGKYIRGVFGGSMPAYDLSIAMGENVVGCLNYYGFGDPINLLAVFATENNGSAIFALTFFIRLYIAGLAMMYYLSTINIGRDSRPMIALAYSFTGFTIFGCAYYIEWISALILLPLVLAEAERYISKKRRKPMGFSLAVCYGALCGFYYLYMVSLVLALYCVVRIIAVDGKFEIKSLFVKCLKLLGEYLLGIGLAAPVLFQALDAFFFSERNSQTLHVLTSSSSYIPNIKSVLRFVYCSLIPRISAYEFGITIFHWLAVIYISIKAIRSRKKRDIQLLIGIVLTIAAVSLPITGYLFNGFSESNTRWYFLVHFLASVSLAAAIENISDRSLSWRKIGTCFCVLFALNIMLNVFIVYSDKGLNLAEQFIPVADVQTYTSTPANHFQTLREDDEVYRIDHDRYTDINGRPDNIAMLNGYNGLSYWFSIINHNTQNYADWSLGRNLSWRSFGFGMNAYTSALAGVKYYFAKEGDDQAVSENYTLLEQITSGGEVWNLYKNNLYKGFVYECREALEYTSGIAGDFEKYNSSIYADTDESNIRDVVYDSNKNRISFSINTDADESQVIIAVPYHQAWKAAVDGENVQTSQFNGMLAIEIPEGKHQIEVVYVPFARNLGIVITIISVIMSACTIDERRMPIMCFFCT